MGAFLMATALLSACSAAATSPNALATSDHRMTKRSVNVVPYEPHLFGLTFPRPADHTAVHLLDVRVLGVPEGLVIDKVWALPAAETDGSVGVIKGGDLEWWRPHLRPVTDVILDPQSPPQHWQLVVECHTTRPGEFTTQGFEILYEVDGKPGKQQFSSTLIKLKTGS